MSGNVRKQAVVQAVFEKTGMNLSVYAARNGLRIHSLYRGIVTAEAAEAFARDGIDIKQTIDHTPEGWARRAAKRKETIAIKKAQRESDEKGLCHTAC